MRSQLFWRNQISVQYIKVRFDTIDYRTRGCTFTTLRALCATIWFCRNCFLIFWDMCEKWMRIKCGQYRFIQPNFIHASICVILSTFYYFCCRKVMLRDACHSTSTRITCSKLIFKFNSKNCSLDVPQWKIILSPYLSLSHWYK